MISSNLEIGKTYTLSYSAPWNDYDVKDVKISAITTENESKTYGIDSIFAEYFAKYDIGISSYVTAMSLAPEIYVCQEVKSRNPYEIDKNVFIIPKYIIDFKNSDELLKCDDYKVLIDSSKSYSELAYNRGKFIESLTAGVKNNIRTLEAFGDLKVSVIVEAKDILMTKTDYELYETTRKKSFAIASEADAANKSRQAKEFAENIAAYDKLQELIASNETKYRDLEDSILSYGNIQRKYVDGVDAILSIKTEILNLFTMIGSGPWDNLQSSITHKLRDYQ